MEWQNPKDVLEAIHQAQLESNDPLLYDISAKGVEAFPESAELWAIRARYLWLLQQEDESQAALRKAFELGPDCAVAWAVRSSIAAGEGRVDESLEAARRALGLAGDEAAVLRYSLDAFHATGDTETALELTARWCSIQDDPESLSQRISTLHASGRKDEAKQLLDEAEQRFHDSVPLMRNRALFMMSSALPDAIRLFQYCTERSPGCSASWAQLAMALVPAQRYAEAEDCARKAICINPREVNAMQTMARLCIRLGRKQEAADWQRKAAEAIPGIAYASALMPAANAARLGQWRKALKCVQPALSAPSPLTRQAAQAIQARALVETHRYKEAERVLDELDRNGWSEAGKYELKGRILMARHDRQGALAQFRAGMKDHPTDGFIGAQMILALQATEDKLEREALVSHIMENPPDTPWGLSAVARAMLSVGYRKEAYRLRWMCAERFPNATDYHMLTCGDWVRCIWRLICMYVKLRWLLIRYKPQNTTKPEDENN